MGFLNWLMKGVGFDSDDSDETLKSPKKKKEKMQKAEEKQVPQQSSLKYSYTDFESHEPTYSSGERAEAPQTYGSYESGYGAGTQTSMYDDGMSAGGYGNKNVVIYRPKNYKDVQKLIDYLKQGESAIIELEEGIPDEEAQRILDFVSGAIYALSGHIHRIKENLFLLTPDGLNILPIDN